MTTFPRNLHVHSIGRYSTGPQSDVVEVNMQWKQRGLARGSWSVGHTTVHGSGEKISVPHLHPHLRIVLQGHACQPNIAMSSAGCYGLRLLQARQLSSRCEELPLPCDWLNLIPAFVAPHYTRKLRCPGDSKNDDVGPLEDSTWLTA